MSRLSGKRILVVEDEYLLASEIEQALVGAGATVIGPFAEITRATAALNQVDLAVLNVNVRDGTTYPLAVMLRDRGIPIVFATGQEMRNEPVEWHSPRWIAKPYDPAEVIALQESASPREDDRDPPG